MSREVYKTTGVYTKGSIALSENLPLKEGEVVVSVSSGRGRGKGNAKEVLKTLKKLAGTMPKLPEGVKYVRKSREESDKRFGRLNW